MKNRRWLLWVIAACFASAYAQNAQDPQDRVMKTPHVDYIDAPGAATGEGDGTIPVAMNKAGEITGWYRDANGNYHGFLRTRKGEYINIILPGGEDSIPSCINKAGAVAGTFYDRQAGWRGFLRAPDGTITVFDAPGGFTRAEAINDDGQVAGIFRPEGGRKRPFLRYPNGKIVTWGTPGGNMELYDTPHVWGVNSKGYVVGDYLYYRSSHSISNPVSNAMCPTCTTHSGVFLRNPNGKLSTFEPFTFTYATGINAGLTIVGYDGWYEDGGARGFLLFANGTNTRFSIRGAKGTYPASINQEGEVAGSYLDQTGVNHAFFRSRHGAVKELTIPEASTQPSSGTAAVQVNDVGGVLGYYTDVNHVFHAFVWWP